MAGDYGKQSGKFGPSPTRDPKSSGKPTAGITNESHGKTGGHGPGPGTPANGSRIR